MQVKKLNLFENKTIFKKMIYRNFVENLWMMIKVVMKKIKKVMKGK